MQRHRPTERRDIDRFDLSILFSITADLVDFTRLKCLTFEMT